MHTHTHTHTQTHTHTHTHTHTPHTPNTHTHTYTNIHTHIYTHTSTHTYTHTYIPTRTHTYTHTHIHTHTHTQKKKKVLNVHYAALAGGVFFEKGAVAVAKHIGKKAFMDAATRAMLMDDLRTSAGKPPLAEGALLLNEVSNLGLATSVCMHGSVLVCVFLYVCVCVCVAAEGAVLMTKCRIWVV
jgi:hypothetical protein